MSQLKRNIIFGIQIGVGHSFSNTSWEWAAVFLTPSRSAVFLTLSGGGPQFFLMVVNGFPPAHPSGYKWMVPNVCGFMINTVSYTYSMICKNGHKIKTIISIQFPFPLTCSVFSVMPYFDLNADSMTKCNKYALFCKKTSKHQVSDKVDEHFKLRVSELSNERVNMHVSKNSKLCLI